MSSIGGAISSALPAVGGLVGNFIAPGAGGAIGTAIGGIAGSAIKGGSGSSGNLNQDQYALELAKWNRYNKIYAPIQDSLSNYYQNLTPEELASKDLTHYQQQFNTNQNLINSELARRNLTGSGIDLGLKNATGLQLSRDKANIIANAPQQVANAKSAFIGAGIVPTGNAGAYANAAQNAQTANRQALGSNIATLTNAIGDANIFSSGEDAQGNYVPSLLNRGLEAVGNWFS